MLNQLQCPGCKKNIETKLAFPLVINCDSCHATFEAKTVDDHTFVKKYHLPATDVSPFHIGLKGVYQDNPFELVGRIRSVNTLAISNLWLMRFKDASTAWLAESSFSLFVSEGKKINLKGNEIKSKTAGKTVKLENKSYTILEITKQVECSVEGEVPLDDYQEEAFYTYELIGEENNIFATICVFEKEVIEASIYRKIELRYLQLANQSSAVIRQPEHASVPKTVSENCPECQKAFPRYIGTSAYTTVCPHCKVIFKAYSGKLLRLQAHSGNDFETYDLAIGSTGVFRDVSYQVIGVARKKEQGTTYYWNEYMVFNAVEGYATLSEYNGHWTFFKELTDLPVRNHYKHGYNFEGLTFEHYSSYRAVIKQVRGEFPFNLRNYDKSETPVSEYIQQPYILSNEVTNEEYVWFKGEYIFPDEIKKAFQLEKLSPPIGVHIIQPFKKKFRIEALTNAVIFFLCILIVFYIYFSSNATEQIVFQRTYEIADSIVKKEIYTDPFELKNGTKNLEIRISSNLNNTWFYTNISLVNEKTGELYNVDIEAERYTGYEDGYYWSEGADWSSKVISMVPEGRYYMIIYPDHSSNMVLSPLQVTVTRDVAVTSNMLIVLLLISVYPGYILIRKKIFDAQKFK